MTEPTNFVEANALLAVAQQDNAHAQAILDKFLDGELEALAIAAAELSHMCADTVRRRGHAIHRPILEEIARLRGNAR